jgi:hypothetical protein
MNMIHKNISVIFFLTKTIEYKKHNFTEMVTPPREEYFSNNCSYINSACVTLINLINKSSKN